MIPQIPSLGFSFVPSWEQITQPITDRAYAVKNSILECYHSDCKVYTLLILGRVLEVAAAATSVVCITAAFIAGPAVLAGLVPAVALYVLGHFMVYNDKSFWYAFKSLPLVDCLIPKPFIPGQPVGIVNSGVDCFKNVFLQCIANLPALRQRARRIPELSQFIDQYLRVQNQAQSRKVLNAPILNRYLTYIIQNRVAVQNPGRRMRENELRYGQGDANVLFEWLLEANRATHIDSFHQFEVTRTRTNGTMTDPAPIQEDLIRLQLNAHEHLEPISVLFNHYLDHITDRNERRRLKFATRPETLAICLERGHMDNNGYRHIIRDPVEGIDAGLTLPPGAFLNGPEAHYYPEAFIIQRGSFTGGHYIICIKKDGRWFLCNDTKVYEISDEEANDLMKDCYLIFETHA